MFFYLRGEFAESFFAAGAQVFIAGGGMQRSSRENEIQSQSMIVLAGELSEYGVKLHQIGFIRLQKYI